MSQSTLSSQSTTPSTPPTPIPVWQWDPIVALNINQKSDGNFTCAGVRNGTTDPCGWNLRGPTAQNIRDMLDATATGTPAHATQSLASLANIMLCSNHQRTQARGKVTNWTAAINALPPQQPPPTGPPAVAVDNTPSPGPRPAAAPSRSITPLASSGNSNDSSQRSIGSRVAARWNRSRRNDTGGGAAPACDATVDDEIDLLRAEFTRLALRLSALEGLRGVRANVGAPMRV